MPDKIEPQRIRIRRMCAADAPALAAVMEWPNAQSQTMQLPYPNLAGWQERAARNEPELSALVAEVDGNVVGHASLRLFDAPRQRHVAHLGISLADPWAGCGIGSRLMAALIEMADQWLQVLRIELTVFADNAAAVALYQKFGFEQEACLRAYAVRDGELCDCLLMARLKKGKGAPDACAA
ncbi:GNAT family N-acetyltransferase [Massilia sp. W12]|uniref:GNAT family N-acetyltransferase n=1 Tax=Massilia sp. W12 TaxID=3126507 RepID=UPI0030D0871D